MGGHQLLSLSAFCTKAKDLCVSALTFPDSSLPSSYSSRCTFFNTRHKGHTPWNVREKSSVYLMKQSTLWDIAYFEAQTSKYCSWDLKVRDDKDQGLSSPHVTSSGRRDFHRIAKDWKCDDSLVARHHQRLWNFH